jgi:hypothetical protein
MYGAGAALADAAPELGAFEIQDVSENPEQGHVARDIDRRALPVDVQCESHGVNSLERMGVGSVRIGQNSNVPQY